MILISMFSCSAKLYVIRKLEALLGIMQDKNLNNKMLNNQILYEYKYLRLINVRTYNGQKKAANIDTRELKNCVMFSGKSCKYANLKKKTVNLSSLT